MEEEIMTRLARKKKHFREVTFTEEELKDFVAEREKACTQNVWMMPLSDDWYEKTSSALQEARDYFKSDEVLKILGTDSPCKVYFDLKWNSKWPMAESENGKIKMNAYYLLAAVGQLFPEKTLRYNRDCLLFTLAHEKNHKGMFLINPSKLARWCEECRSDILAVHDLKVVRGNEITSDYVAELMRDREKYEKDPLKESHDHPSRRFRSEIVTTSGWSEDTIDEIAKRVYHYNGSRWSKLNIAAVKKEYRAHGEFQ